MIGQKKTTKEKTFNLISYKDGEVTYNFNIAMVKTLVGSFEGADLSIKSPFVSHYHAFLTYNATTNQIILADL